MQFFLAESLIACGWLEQNAGATPVLRSGVVAACYRVTAAGLRALRQARDGDPGEDDQLAEVGQAEATRSTSPRARRAGKVELPGAAALPVS